MKQRLNMNEFIKQNYIPVYDLAGEQGYSPRITIYKAKIIEELPQDLIDYLKEMHKRKSTFEGKRITGGICDQNNFNANYISIYNHRNGLNTHIKLYVNAILRKPFTEYQTRHYKELAQILPSKRIYHIFDSANDADIG